jgi:hypothetical protein
VAAAALAVLVVAGHHMLVLWLDFGNRPSVSQPDFSFTLVGIGGHSRRALPAAESVALHHFSVHLDDARHLHHRGTAIARLACRHRLCGNVAGILAFAVRRFGGWRGHAFGQTHGLAIVYAFVIPSYVTWAFGFSYLRYAAPLEMLTGIVTVGTLLWLFDDRRWRIGSALAVVPLAGVTTVYLDWEKVGHGPSRLRYGDRYVDVRVPPLPADSVVLIATWDPVAFFIPYAEPRAQYVGIENNYLELSQHNLLAEKVKHLMREPGRPKFVLNVDRFDADKLNALLAHFDLKLGALPCLSIETNLEGHALSLCPAVES